MIKTLKITLLFSVFTFFSCSENNNLLKIDLEGNWSYIDLDEEYYEVLIDSFSMLFYHESAGFLNERNYKLKNDSLFIFLPEKLNSTKPYRFNRVGSEVFLSDIDNFSDTLVRMKRIDTSEFTFDKIKNFADENEELKFIVAYNNRKNAIFKIDVVYSLDSIIDKWKSMEIPEIIEISEHKPSDDNH